MGGPMHAHVLFAASILTALAWAAPAKAAIELEAGLWQTTETGTEDGEPAEPEVSNDCMSAEDAKDPVKSLTKLKDQSAGKCQTLDLKQSGNSVSFNFQCGDRKQMSFDMAASYTFVDRKNYTGTMKSAVVFGGQKTTADKKIVSKWIGACTK